jgi:hypothetical protein
MKREHTESSDNLDSNKVQEKEWDIISFDYLHTHKLPLSPLSSQ